MNPNLLCGKSKKCGRRSAEMGRADKIIEASNSTFTRTLSKKTTILHNQLQLRPYKLQLVQDLKEDDYEQRVKFGEWVNSHWLTKFFGATKLTFT